MDISVGLIILDAFARVVPRDFRLQSLRCAIFDCDIRAILRYFWHTIFDCDLRANFSLILQYFQLAIFDCNLRAYFSLDVSCSDAVSFGISFALDAVFL